MDSKHNDRMVSDEKLDEVVGGFIGSDGSLHIGLLPTPEDGACEHYLCRHCAGKEGAHRSMCRYTGTAEIDCCLSCKHIYYTERSIPSCGYYL